MRPSWIPDHKAQRITTKYTTTSSDVQMSDVMFFSGAGFHPLPRDDVEAHTDCKRSRKVSHANAHTKKSLELIMH